MAAVLAATEGVIRCAGIFAAYRNGQRIKLSHRQAEQVLAYLVVHGESRRDDVAAAIWPQSPRDKGFDSLRQAIAALRRAGLGDWILSRRLTLALDEGVRMEVPVTRADFCCNWDDAWVQDYRSGGDSSGSLLEEYRRLSSDPASPSSDAVSEQRLLARRLYMGGKISESLECYGRIGRGAMDGGDLRLGLYDFGSMVIVLREAGRTDEAALLLKRIKARASRLRDVDLIATLEYQEGLLQFYNGNVELASLILTKTARKAWDSMGGLRRAFLEVNVGIVAFDLGEPEHAWACSQRALVEANSAGDHLAEVSAQSLANMVLAKEQDSQALIDMWRNYHLAHRLRFLPIAATMSDRIAQASSAQRDWEGCARALRFGQALRQQLGTRPTQLERRILQATVQDLRRAVGGHSARELLRSGVHAASSDGSEGL